MVTIVLDIADNGVVKILEDDNVNGGGEMHVSKTLYDFEADPNFENRINFLKDLCLDIGLSLGSDLDKSKLNIAVRNKPKELGLMTKKELEASIGAAERLVEKYKKELKKYEP